MIRFIDGSAFFVLSLRRAGLGFGLACLVLTGACTNESHREGEVSEHRLRSEAERLWQLPGEVQEVLLDPDPLRRAEALARLLRGLEPEALEDVLEAYDTVYLDLGDFELELLAEWWAAFDPQAAMEWAEDDWRASHPQIYSAILRVWARTEPRAALAAAEAEQRAPVRRVRVAAVLRGWDEGTESGALDFVEGLAGDYQQYMTGVLARRRVARDGVEATLAWADSLRGPLDLTKLSILRRVASAAAEEDPAQVAAWVEPILEKHPRSRLPQRVATRWVKRDPEAAMAWLASLPAGVDRKTGVREAYRRWLRHDRPAARTWLEAREPEPWQDEARALYALSWLDDHPGEGEYAANAALPIDREELRWATVVRVWRVWLPVDKATAEKWYVARAEEIPEFYREKMMRFPSGTLKRLQTDESGAADVSPDFVAGEGDATDAG